MIFKSDGQFQVGSGQSLSAHFEFNVVGDPTQFNHTGLSLTSSSHGVGGSGQVTAMLDNDLPGMTVRTTTPFGVANKNLPELKQRGHVVIDFRMSGGVDFDALTKFDSFSFYVTEQPEPASLTLLGLGAVGLVGYRIRRRRRLNAA